MTLSGKSWEHMTQDERTAYNKKAEENGSIFNGHLLHKQMQDEALKQERKGQTY